MFQIEGLFSKAEINTLWFRGHDFFFSILRESTTVS